MSEQGKKKNKKLREGREKKQTKDKTMKEK